jgi:hypothetical protein
MPSNRYIPVWNRPRYHSAKDGARVSDDPIEYGYQRGGSYDPTPEEIARECPAI